MKLSPRLIFFGNERLATGLDSTDAPVLTSLIEQGYDVVAVVANYSPGRSRSARRLEIANIAAQYNIPVFLPAKTIDILPELTNFRADAAILVAYGKIIPSAVIDLFPRGIINIHPSLLPKYRGPTPIEQSILDGVSMTGVSIMKIGTGMDSGPVYAQAQYKLERHETKPELARHLLALGKDMLLDILPSILDGSAQPDEQNHSKATYCNLLTKDDGIINPSIQTARDIERSVRAYAGYPKTKHTINGHAIVILEAEVVNEFDPKELIVECHDSSYLRITQLTGPSGRAMSGSDFIRGYSKR